MIHQKTLIENITLTNKSFNTTITNQNEILGSVSLSKGVYNCSFYCALYFENITAPLNLFSYIGTSSPPYERGSDLGSVYWTGIDFTGIPSSFSPSGIYNNQIITIENDNTTLYFSIFIMNKESNGTLRLNQESNGNVTNASFAKCIKIN